MKNIHFWHLCLVISLSIGSLNYAQSPIDLELDDNEQLIEFTTDRFTLPNLHVTPDKKHIIFDVLGDIYQVPIEGGKAEVLLQDSNWKRGAKLSPDGKTLAYVSDESGEFQVWTYNFENRERKEYPIVESLHFPLYSYWKNNNKLLIPDKEGLNSFNIKTGKRVLVRKAKQDEKSVMHAINRTMYITLKGGDAYFQKEGKLWKNNINNEKESVVGKIPLQGYFDFFKVSPNNKSVLFYNKDTQDNSKEKLVYWDLETDMSKVFSDFPIPGSSTMLNYNFDFIDDSSIVLDMHGKIVRVNVKTGEYQPIPIEVKVKKIIKKPLHKKPQYIKDSIITASVLRNPVSKPDLDTIYFGAFGKLHTYSKTAKEIREVFPDKNRFEISPSLSPNGKHLAYTTWNDWEMGHLYVRELSTGREYQITKDPGRYINPAWSPDGMEIVFIADETETKMGIRRLSSGANTHNYHLDIYRISIFKNNEIQTNLKSDFVHQVFPHSISPQRFYPIPVYHPNGRNIYVTTRNQRKDLPVLVQINLDSRKVVNEKTIPFHTDEVVIAPDGQHIALIYDQQVWVDTFPYPIKLEFYEDSEFMNKQLQYHEGVVNRILLPKAKSIYEIAPSYLFWQDKNTLMWGSAGEVYTYDIPTQKTQKVAEIKVQKSRAVPKAKYALTHSRIITINNQEEIIEKGTILVKNNRITAVGPDNQIKIPKGYKIFDLSGKTILPGLIDVHSHSHHSPYEFMNQQEHQYMSHLAYGVTTIYDPNSNVLNYREQAQLVEAGEIIGPRILSSGNIIYYFPNFSRYYTLNNSLDSDRLILSMLKLGVSGPMKDYIILNSNSKKLLYNSAQRNGLSITTHQDQYLGVMSSVLNGYTAIEHDIRAPIQKDIFKIISLSGVTFTPTYLVTPGIGNTYNEKTNENKLVLLNGETLFQHLYKRYYSKAKDSNQIKYNNQIKNRYQNSITKLKSFVAYGANVTVGGHGDPLPGIGTHWETWFMTNEMSNYQALKAATIMGAQKLDLQEEIGSIEKGKLADLTVLNSNPIDNIFNTTDILYTIQNGNIYQANTMNQTYPKKVKLKPWGWNSPIVLKSIQHL